MKKLMMANLLMLLSVTQIQGMNDCEEVDLLITPSNDELICKDRGYSKKIKSFDKNRDHGKKDRSLVKIINGIESGQKSKNKLDKVVKLIGEGANPNIKFMGESLLHKALLMDAKDLICALFEKNVEYTDMHYLIGPVFFDAPSVEIAQLFIDKGVDVNSTNGNDQNVLWHLIDSKFSVDLVSFYLSKNVNESHIDKYDNASVLHSFAAYKEVKDEDVFLSKARVILAKNPSLVSVVDHNGETPIVIAEKTIKVWGKKYPTCVSPLQKLINLFKEVV